jgi:hypothetical protein
MAPSRRFVPILAVAAAVLGASTPGPAYNARRDTKGKVALWNTDAAAANVVAGRVSYYIDGASATGGVTGEQFASAVRLAVDEWEAVPDCSLEFLEDPGRPSTTKTSTDRINRFGFTPGVLPNGAFAAAFTATVNGTITDVDLVFNPEMDWAVEFPGNPERADVAGVAVHEWGHGLGFDHSPIRSSTMFFAATLGAVSLRSTSPDDKAIAGLLYPEPSFATANGVIRGEVDIPGTADDRGVQVAVIDFVSGVPVVSSFSFEDGSYAIEGIPPGVYRVVATPIGTVAVAGGVYSPYWHTAETRFLPAVHPGTGGAGATGVFVVEAGDEITGVDFALSDAVLPHEPNESRAAAVAVAVGNSAIGRIEGFGDIDYYSFTATAGDRVSLFLHAQQLGSTLNPRLVLQNSAGTNLVTSNDISIDDAGPGGADRDCRILDAVIPTDGTYFLRIEAQTTGGPSPDPDFPEDYFYIATVLAGGGTASPFTSEFSLSPEIQDADGISTVTATFTPRTLTGTLSGEGLEVTFALVADADGDAVPGPVTDNLDGTYSALLVAPNAAAADTVQALVGATVIATAEAQWLGAADFDASPFAATPRRVRADGVSQTTVLLEPRDARGLALGEGRTVVLGLAGGPPAGIEGTVDQEDGTYGAVVTAGAERGTILVGATVDGNDLGGTLGIGLGFPLDEVVDEGIEVLAGAEGLPAKAVAKATAALKALEAVEGLDPSTATDAILVGAKKAAKQVEAAVKKGATGLASVALDLAEAAREAATDAIAERGPFADQPNETKALAKAEALVAAADAVHAAGKYSAAVGKYRAALKQAIKIVE